MRLRHHLPSLLVTALALTLGLGIGAGPVAERSTTESRAERDRLAATALRLQDEVASLTRGGAADAEALGALAHTVVGDRLVERTVVVVATPGAARADVRRVRSDLEKFGATVVGTLTLTDTYVDPARAQSPLEDLALRLVPPGVEFPDGAGPIRRVGSVLARAVVQRPDDGVAPSGEIDQDAAEVIAGLDELGALRLAGDPGLRAEAAVVVAGDDPDEAQDALAGLVAALEAGSRGVVVAGPGDAEGGLLRWVRDETVEGLSGVSTVDNAATAAGRAGVLLAVAEQVEGGDGAYGSGRRADAPVPADLPAADGRVSATTPPAG